ncbi:hypothetical protein NDI45_19395 [Leptolyngbya sp. GB1-A1]|uniref:hypothetical protein n=1 Tax=Leptolyngbya sp. GB1-A1 TaxID=2933908 RepID=UPI003297E718
MTKTTVDELPVSQLPDRYGISRSVLYTRINALKIKPEQRGNKSYVSREQLDLLDRLHNHIQQGGSTAEFLASAGLSDEQTGQTVGQSDEQTGQLALSDSAPLLLIIDALAEKLASQQMSDPLANLRAIEEAACRGWLLSSSQLASLLGLRSLSGKSFDRYGFSFTRAGRNGAEIAWRITKIQAVEGSDS